MNADPIHITGDSVTAAIGSGGATNIALPVDSAGEIPRKCRVVTDLLVGFKPIVAGETPALAVMARLAPDESIILYTRGYASLRCQTPTGTANVTITPIENG